MSGAKELVTRQGVLEILPFLYKEFIICSRLVLFLHFSIQLVWEALVWICDPNYHKILPTLALNFSKNY